MTRKLISVFFTAILATILVACTMTAAYAAGTASPAKAAAGSGGIHGQSPGHAAISPASVTLADEHTMSLLTTDWFSKITERQLEEVQPGLSVLFWAFIAVLAGFGGLVALSVGGVLAISVYTNFTNTFALINDQAVQLITGMEQSFRRDAEEAERAVSAVAQLYRRGDFEIGDGASQTPLLRAILLSEPVVESIVLFDTDGVRSGTMRHPDRGLTDLAAGRSIPSMGAVPARPAAPADASRPPPPHCPSTTSDGPASCR